MTHSFNMTTKVCTSSQNTAQKYMSMKNNYDKKAKAADATSKLYKAQEAAAAADLEAISVAISKWRAEKSTEMKRFREELKVVMKKKRALTARKNKAVRKSATAKKMSDRAIVKRDKYNKLAIKKAEIARKKCVVREKKPRKSRSKKTK